MYNFLFTSKFLPSQMLVGKFIQTGPRKQTLIDIDSYIYAVIQCHWRWMFPRKERKGYTMSDFRLCIDVHHCGNAGTIHIGIKQTNLELTLSCKCNSQINCQFNSKFKQHFTHSTLRLWTGGARLKNKTEHYTTLNNKTTHKTTKHCKLIT